MLRGILAGSLLLFGLEAVTQSSGSAGRFGSIFTSIGNIAQHVLNPDIPAIPDLRRHS